MRASTRPSPFTGLRAAALALAFMAASAMGAAQAQETAQGTTQAYEDWTIGCQANQAGQQECLMFQDIIADGTDQSIMRVTVVKMPRPMIIVTTPLGVMLVPGLAVAIDQQEVSRMQFQICIEPGCRSQIDLPPELVQRFKSGVAATITLVGPNGQPIPIPVSLKGFTAAYDALI